MTNLKRIRAYHGYSQDQLASSLGVHRNTVANWEEKGDLPLSKAVEIANLFGIPVGELATPEPAEAVNV